MVALTPRQRECLDVIQRLSLDGVPPSFREIGDALGIVSKSNVHRLVHGLAERGAIHFRPGRVRSIAVVRKASRPVPFDAMAAAINDAFFGGDAVDAAIRRVLVAAWKRARAA